MRTRLLAMAVGQGLVTVHDAKHRKQRKMMMPAFHLETLKTFVPTFLALGKTMVAAMKEDKGLSSRYDGSTFPHVVDVSKYAEAATLDLIGLTGFKYNFGAMDCLAQKKGVESELARGLRDAMNATLNASTMDKFVTLVLSALFPSLATLPFTPSNRAWRRARRTMESVTSNILDERLKKLVSELQDCGESIEKVRKDQQGLQDQDLLTTLLRANLAVDVSPKERLDRQELLGQVRWYRSLASLRCLTVISAFRLSSSRHSCWLATRPPLLQQPGSSTFSPATRGHKNGSLKRSTSSLTPF